MSQRLTAAVILKRKKQQTVAVIVLKKSDAIYDDVAKEISKSNHILHYKIPCKIPHRIFD